MDKIDHYFKFFILPDETLIRLQSISLTENNPEESFFSRIDIEKKNNRPGEDREYGYVFLLIINPNANKIMISDGKL